MMRASRHTATPARGRDGGDADDGTANGARGDDDDDDDDDDDARGRGEGEKRDARARDDDGRRARVRRGWI